MLCDCFCLAKTMMSSFIPSPKKQQRVLTFSHQFSYTGLSKHACAGFCLALTRTHTQVKSSEVMMCTQIRVVDALNYTVTTINCCCTFAHTAHITREKTCALGGD